MGSYIDGMLRYFEFSGRSTRMQYWMFFLLQFVLICAGVAIDYKMGARVRDHWSQMPITLFMIIIHIVPGITVQARRLHDIGKSGARYLLNFVPLGGLVLLYWACRASDNGHGDTGDDQLRSRRREPPRSSIPRGVRMGSAQTAGRVGPLPAEGRFI